jgi:hypothetical protein
MTQEEYTKAIERQQSLIKRLFRTRKKRSEEINNIVQERYGELVGKFFKPIKKFQYATIGSYYYITEIIASSDYIMDTRVDIRLVCRTFYPSQQAILKVAQKETGIGMETVGISFGVNTFEFDSADDIIKILEPMLVTKEEAMAEFDKITNEIKENFLKIRCEKLN